MHENSDKYFENKCLYHVRWFDILCMISYKDDWNNDWNNRNDDLESYNNESIYDDNNACNDEIFMIK